MLTPARVIRLAKRLVAMSFDDASGEIVREKVRAIITYISECPEQYRAKLMRKYAYFLEEAIRQKTLSIEYAQKCDVERIKQMVFAKTQRAFSVDARANPELICGVRLSFDDFVWERSVRGDLELIAR